MRALYDIAQVAEMIKQGKKLVLAGDETALAQLPRGEWIGGTIPYFMTEKGGVFAKDEIFVTELPSYVVKADMKVYDENSLPDVYQEGPVNGFSIIILPASSPVHLSFALNAPSYKNFATNPLIGWISGVNVNDIGKLKPKVFSGDKGEVFDNAAVVAHVELPKNKYAEIGLVNLFHQGQGDKITFDSTSFSTTDAFINGKKMNFADYVETNKLDIKLPLVANYCGAMINISFQGVDEAGHKVNFYAPVFSGVEYRHAAAMGDYVSEFTKHMPADNKDKIFFSCNCILNYLYGELEGKSTGGIVGPITFGEIAYQLLNQTMAYITVADV
jgi:hypothetical protein